MQTILLQPIGDVGMVLVVRLKEMLESTLSGLHFQVAKRALPLLSTTYNKERNQYMAEENLKVLHELIINSSFSKVLGILDVDIYAPGFNFIFGQAEKPGKAALISLTRLRPEFYGHKSNDALFYERILKEALHEIGHMFGLDHCNRQCVMKFSNSIYDTDRKPASFCFTCTLKMAKAMTT
ncbi:MAG: archaemetzincin family Zn-dependent metalloprotease [Candidatus Nezhaarchaeales archaeon]